MRIQKPSPHFANGISYKAVPTPNHSAAADFSLMIVSPRPEPVETIIPSRITYLMDPPPSRRRGKRKPS